MSAWYGARRHAMMMGRARIVQIKMQTQTPAVRVRSAGSTSAYRQHSSVKALNNSQSSRAVQRREAASQQPAASQRPACIADRISLIVE
eukprot:COSAG06_NODE_6144_length_3087_cov_14.947122_6_plen_89_part_00